MPTTFDFDERLLPALQRLAAARNESVSATVSWILFTAAEALDQTPLDSAPPSEPDAGAHECTDLLDAILIAGQGVCRSSIR